MKKQYSGKGTGNLSLTVRLNGKVAGYEMDANGKPDYPKGIKQILQVIKIERDKVRVLLNAPGIIYLRYELLPLEQQKAVNEVLIGKQNNLEGKV